VRAVVAESPFSAYRSVAARHARRLVPVDWLARFLATITVSDGYDPIAVVARLAPRPLLVIAAEQDEICFPDEARALYDAAGSPKDFWLVPGAEHLAIALEAQSEPTARVRALFDQAARR